MYDKKHTLHFFQTSHFKNCYQNVHLALISISNTNHLLLCSTEGETLPSVVVGVVGIGHVKGIVENWDNETADIEEICR